MSARHEHKEIKKILCPDCKTTDTMYIDVPKNMGGPRREVVPRHSDRCTSEAVVWCCQYTQSYSYYDRCGKPVRGHLRNGTPVCGLHKSVEERRIKKEEAEASRREIGAYLRDQMNEKLKLIEQLTGIVGQLHYRRGYNYFASYLDSEYILIKADDLIAAIEIEVE